MRRLVALMMPFMLLIGACQGPDTESLVKKAPAQQMDPPIEKKLAQQIDLPIEKKKLAQQIGQTIVVGFEGTSETDDGVQKIAQALRDGLVGSVIFYARNVKSPDQVKALTAHLRSVQPEVMFFVDQEGGLVQRLNEKNGFSHRYPKAIDIASQPENVARREYADMAVELRAHGITDNLAPVVDLNTNPDSPVIGRLGRSFSADPDVVERFARIFIDAHASVGIRTYLKHYPGHGSATSDSHLGFTDITSTWDESELLPYKSLIASGHARAIMTAHVFHAGVDAQFPATLSKKWIGERLRDELGFKGVVITDDLHMKAIAAQWKPEEAALLALRAGCDILLFSNNLKAPPMTLEALKRFIADAIEKVEAGDTELEHRFVESYERIARFRMKSSR